MFFPSNFSHIIFAKDSKQNYTISLNYKKAYGSLPSHNLLLIKFILIFVLYNFHKLNKGSNMESLSLITQLTNEINTISFTVSKMEDHLKKIDTFVSMMSEKTLFEIEELDIKNDKNIKTIFNDIGHDFKDIVLDDKDGTLNTLKNIQKNIKDFIKDNKLYIEQFNEDLEKLKRPIFNLDEEIDRMSGQDDIVESKELLK